MRRALLAAATVLLLAGCAPATDGGSGDGPGSRLGQERVPDVDTPELRRIKEAAGIASCRPGPGEPVEGGLPDLALDCLGGGPQVNLGSLRGPLVVNVWAQWCGPCKHELPIYQQFHERHGDRVGVLGIDFNDMHPADALALARRSGVTYPQLADPAARLIGPLLAPSDALPVHLFVDAEGRLAHREAVEVRSLAQLEGLVEEHLGVAL